MAYRTQQLRGIKMACQEDLDRLAAQGCGNPGCTHHHELDPLFLHPRCHIGGGVEVSYMMGTGLLSVTCAKCHKAVVVVEVASAG